MIPQQFIDDLLRRVDVVEVVGQYVQLKRTGANYSGLCPFHTEKSPSFSVSPSKQFYHCFGCGAHGTALGFLIEHLGLPFPQAVEDLARRVGLEVPQESRDRSPQEIAARRQQTDLRARLKDYLLEAAKFYQRRLKDSPQAIAYLKGRGLSGEIAQRYHLGFSPEGWQPLQAVFSDYEHRDLVEAGLVIEGEGGKRYDRFRNRIMFPIVNARGEVVGFGARTLGADEPKYLNSPETPVFSKGFELYGVFEGRAAIREAGQIWVVEGYMDVVALAQHGLGHAVATLGTATTPAHLQALLRLSDHVVFMFDGDTAGRKAAARALETALPFASEKNRIDFVFLPPEHDPDSFVRAQGAQALRDFVSQASPLSAWVIEHACEGKNLDYAEGRAAAMAEVSRQLRLMSPNPLRSQIARAAARRFDADEGALLASAQPEPAARAPSPGLGRRSSVGRPAGARLPRPVIRPLAERVLQILVRCPDWCAEVDAEVSAALETAQFELLEWIRAKAANGPTTFAVLHETACAEGREKGSEATKLFLRLAKPDSALDEMLEEHPDQLKSEYMLSIKRLRIRIFEEEAARLAELAAKDPAAMQALSELRARIGRLKHS